MDSCDPTPALMRTGLTHKTDMSITPCLWSLANLGSRSSNSEKFQVTSQQTTLSHLTRSLSLSVSLSLSRSLTLSLIPFPPHPISYPYSYTRWLVLDLRTREVVSDLTD